MSIRNLLTVAACTVALAALIVPALAQVSSRIMGGGCTGIMQSMNGADGRPNSQWRTHSRAGGSLVD
jgi:hypothetical protein